ncbi:hypothetical protein [Geodermatophilus sp. SYSU D00703]
MAPSIAFIDEIDMIGRARGSAVTQGGHERSTLRPHDHGQRARLDGRRDILKVHVRKVLLAADVDLREIAAITPGVTGVDLADLVNQAALGTARRGADAVTLRDFAGALESDPARRGAQRRHAAGGAPADRVPRGRPRAARHAAAGRGPGVQGVDHPARTRARRPPSTPDADRYGFSEQYLRGRIIGALSGMAAEEEVFGVVTTGRRATWRGATRIARAVAGRRGVSGRIGPVSVPPKDADPRVAGVSEAMLDGVDCEVRRISDEGYAEARRLLRENRDELTTNNHPRPPTTVDDVR